MGIISLEGGTGSATPRCNESLFTDEVDVVEDVVFVNGGFPHT